MLQIKHLTAPQKMPIFNFQDLQTGRGGNDTQRPPARRENYYELVIV